MRPLYFRMMRSVGICLTALDIVWSELVSPFWQMIIPYFNQSQTLE